MLPCRGLSSCVELTFSRFFLFEFSELSVNKGVLPWVGTYCMNCCFDGLELMYTSLPFYSNLFISCSTRWLFWRLLGTAFPLLYLLPYALLVFYTFFSEFIIEPLCWVKFFMANPPEFINILDCWFSPPLAF